MSKARKRLYMTATPADLWRHRQSKADEVGAELASMDDESLFGEDAVLPRLRLGRRRTAC